MADKERQFRLRMSTLLKWICVFLGHAGTKAFVSGTDMTLDVHEYCQGDAFEAECGHGEVIIISRASYGRMRLGRCIKRDYGSLGCASDVSAEMSQLCSGRTKCHIPYVVGVLFEYQPCGELKTYLEASYFCEKVVRVPAMNCPPGSSTPVPLPSGTLSNAVTEETGCGSTDSPWVIRASFMQKVTFTIREFHPLPENATSDPDSCELYGVIKDGVSHVNMCRGHSSTRHLYRTGSNRVQVQFTPPGRNGGLYVLLNYEVIGCPEMDFPKDMWVRRGRDHVTMGCYSSKKSWRLDCRNNTWTGSVGNCSKMAASMQSDVPMDTPVPAVGIESIPVEPTYISDDIALVMAVCGGVVLSLLLLAVGLLFDKSRENQETSQTYPQSVNQVYHPNCIFSQHTASKDSQQRNNGTLTTVPPHPLHRMTNGHPSSGINGLTSGQNTERMQLLPPGGGDRTLSRTSGDYDVPHYYELDPDYEGPRGQANHWRSADDVTAHAQRD